MIGVIGATGNIGSRIIEKLSKTSSDVIAISRKQQTNMNGVQWRTSDLWDYASLKAALSGCDVVYFMIPLELGWTDFYEKINSAIENFLAVAKDLNIPRVVALSSLGAHRKESIGMFHMARLIECKFSNQNFDVTFVRPAEFMENWSHSKDAAQYGGVLPNFHIPTNKKFHQVSVRDIADVCVSALLGQTKERIIHVIGPNVYSAEDVKEAFVLKYNRPIEFVTPPRNEWESEFQKYGMSMSYAKELAGLYDAINSGIIEIDSQTGAVIKGHYSISDVISGI